MEKVNFVRYTRSDLASIAGLTSSMKVDGHRADLVTLRGAQAHAAFFGRTMINEEDIVLAAELALPHRIKARPFHDVSVNAYDLQDRLAEVQKDWGEADAGQDTDKDQEETAVGKKKA
jgi:Mg-chelatase subunit ChlI